MKAGFRQETDWPIGAGSSITFSPAAVAEHIAGAIPTARLVTLTGCGHFACLECATDVRKAFNDFFERTRAAGRTP